MRSVRRPPRSGSSARAPLGGSARARIHTACCHLRRHLVNGFRPSDTRVALPGRLSPRVQRRRPREQRRLFPAVKPHILPEDVLAEIAPARPPPFAAADISVRKPARDFIESVPRRARASRRRVRDEPRPVPRRSLCPTRPDSWAPQPPPPPSAPPPHPRTSPRPPTDARRGDVRRDSESSTHHDPPKKSVIIRPSTRFNS